MQHVPIKMFRLHEFVKKCKWSVEILKPFGNTEIGWLNFSRKKVVNRENVLFCSVASKQNVSQYLHDHFLFLECLTLCEIFQYFTMQFLILTILRKARSSHTKQKT